MSRYISVRERTLRAILDSPKATTDQKLEASGQLARMERERTRAKRVDAGLPVVGRPPKKAKSPLARSEWARETYRHTLDERSEDDIQETFRRRIAACITREFLCKGAEGYWDALAVQTLRDGTAACEFNDVRAHLPDAHELVWLTVFGASERQELHEAYTAAHGSNLVAIGEPILERHSRAQRASLETLTDEVASVILSRLSAN